MTIIIERGDFKDYSQFIQWAIKNKLNGNWESIWDILEAVGTATVQVF